MDFPWTEAATLVRMPAAQKDDEGNELLFEGSLLLMAQKVRAMKPIDRRHLKISLPNRIVRPHTFKDGSLAALIDDIPVVG
ncbi:hypothetical protein [Sphingomonas sp. TWP1-3-1]|uniref:hypothetical protein n=1 Tax=Sphingomonas sp. TWP1-3-1 TaxID=2804612 RepID=UPI003CFA0D17